MSSSKKSHDSTQDEDSNKSFLERKSQILDALFENKLETFKSLFDSPEWYDIDIYHGYNCLQVAISRSSKEIFDYILSIPNFPLEYTNKKGDTALVVALDSFTAEGTFIDEHFVYELVKKAVCLDVVNFCGNTPLHCAVQRSYCKLVKLLLEKGVEVNALNSKRQTPLELTSTSSNDFEEILSVLVMYGAEASIELFEKLVVEKAPLHIQENLFFYWFDEYSNFDISFDLLVALVTSPLFHELIKCPVGLGGRKEALFLYFQMLCRMDFNNLKIIIETFNDSLRQAFEGVKYTSFNVKYLCSDPINMNSLNLLIESNLSPAVMSSLEVWSGIGLKRLLIDDPDESLTTELYCYFLSYGLAVAEQDLREVYEKFGHCELFKILLHMDIKLNTGDSIWITGNLMPVLNYDVNLTLSKILEVPQNPNIYRYVEKFLDYFAHPMLKAHLMKAEEGLVSEKRNIPDVPRLEELARNTFRTFFIEKFQIKTSRQFHTLVKCLPVNNVYKKVITYETKLY